MVTKIIKNERFRTVATNVKPDTRKRVILSKAILNRDVTYHVYCNEIGQILLDPQVSIPAAEAWLFNNPAARQAVAKGLQEAAAGKVTSIKLKKL